MIDIVRALTVGGWMSPAELEWLAEHAAECEYILELGTYRGRSTVAMLDNSDAHIWCVDTWNYKKCGARDLTIFRQNIAKQSSRVTILQMKTREAITELADLQFDMVFIDACHTYGVVRQDIIDYRPLVVPGGLFCGHDYLVDRPGHGVVQAVNALVPGFQVYETIWWVCND